MTFLPRFPGSIGSHAVSAAANARDGLRTARYFIQELSTADDAGGSKSRPPTWLLPTDAPAALITGFIAQNARIADKVMHWSSDTAATLLAPDRRAMPSPFDPDTMRGIVAVVTGEDSGAHALFNDYFYRAGLRILRRSSKPPHLVLENRIDAARRALAAAAARDASDVAVLAHVLITLVRAAPVVEAGAIDPSSDLLKTKDPNVGIAAIAVAALLFGLLGKPTPETSVDRFFGIVGALIAPHLPEIERLITRCDLANLEAELARIKATY